MGASQPMNGKVKRISNSTKLSLMSAVAFVPRGDIEQFGLSVCDTGNADAIANAAKFIDWMYTDEAMELVSCGKEGEIYEVVEGKKKALAREKPP